MSRRRIIDRDCELSLLRCATSDSRLDENLLAAEIRAHAGTKMPQGHRIQKRKRKSLFSLRWLLRGSAVKRALNTCNCQNYRLTSVPRGNPLNHEHRVKGEPLRGSDGEVEMP